MYSATYRDQPFLHAWQSHAPQAYQQTIQLARECTNSLQIPFILHYLLPTTLLLPRSLSDKSNICTILTNSFVPSFIYNTTSFMMCLLWSKILTVCEAGDAGQSGDRHARDLAIHGDAGHGCRLLLLIPPYNKINNIHPSWGNNFLSGKIFL